MGYGQDAFIGISFQSSYGTANTTSVDYLPFNAETLTETIDDIVSEGMRNRFEEGASCEGAHTVEGDIQMEVHPIVIGKIIKAWTGHESATLNDSAYSHQFLPATADFDTYAATPPMTFEVYRGVDSSFQYYDMLCNQFTIEIAQGALIRSTATFVGGKFAFINNTAPSYIAGSCFPWDITSVSIGGAAVDNASQITMTFNNNIEPIHVLDATKTPGRAKRTGYRTVEVAGTVFFDNSSQYQIFRARTQQRLIVTMTGQTTATSYNNTLTVDIPKMLYTEYPVNVGGAGQIEVGFSGKGKFDETSVYIAEFTLVNTEAAY
jgi:hypothetical protein